MGLSDSDVNEFHLNQRQAGVRLPIRTVRNQGRDDVGLRSHLTWGKPVPLVGCEPIVTTEWIARLGSVHFTAPTHTN